MELRHIGLAIVTAVCLQVTQLAYAQFDNPGCGHLGEPCCTGLNGEDTCQSPLTCDNGGCQDFSQPTKLQDLPVLTLDLVITSCDDASKILMGGSGPSYYVEMGTGDRMFVDPQGLFQVGATDAIGVRLNGVTHVRDIQEITLGVWNADICISRLQLLVNGWNLFTKDFNPAQHMIGTHYPISESVLTLSGAELRNTWNRFPGHDTCVIPEAIEGTSLQRELRAVLGDALFQAAGSSASGVTVKKAYYGGGFLRTSKLNASTLHVESKFDTDVNAHGFESTVSVTIDFDITPKCAPSGDNVFDNAVSLDISPIHVKDVDGNILEDLVIAIASPENSIQNMLNQRLDMVRESFKTIARNLQACPAFVIDDNTPPSVNLEIDPFLLQFANQTEDPFCR
jgi:hypothetical protein